MSARYQETFVSPPRLRTRHLTVLLVKEEFDEYESALKNPDALYKYNLRPGLAFSGALYLSAPSHRSPRWADFLQSGTAQPIGALENVSTAAVLFVEVASRVLAFAFGYGRNLLRPDSYEVDFGLRVALNTVDPDRLRSVDVRTFEELTLHTRRQTSRGATLETFGLDVSRDLLRAVTGEPRDLTLASRVTGADALSLTTQVEFSGLGAKCQQMLEAYAADSYRERFGWIDQMRAVRDRHLLDALDEQLLQALQADHLEKLHLAPPEPLEWDRVEGFRFSTEEQNVPHHPDLDIEDYLATVGDSSEVSIEDLKKHRIEVLYSEQDQAVARWSVYQSLVFETERDAHLYVLTGARWFEIAKDFAESVSQYVVGLPSSSLALPSAQVGEKEAQYNERVAAADERLVLMDRRLVRCGGGQGRIEVCDLFSSDRHFVHVKRRLRSATLSHLFAQGTVSAEAFLRDPEFRQDARSIVRESRPGLAALIPDNRPSPGDFEVVYAIIAASANGSPLSLPFFSQLHLMQASQRLYLLGYRVSTLMVEEG